VVRLCAGSQSEQAPWSGQRSNTVGGVNSRRRENSRERRDPASAVTRHQRVRPNLVPCPNLILFASTTVCCAGRPATRYRAAREPLPRVPTAFQGSKCVCGGGSSTRRREYQVKARYQVRANACYHSLTCGIARRKSSLRCSSSSDWYTTHTVYTRISYLYLGLSNGRSGIPLSDPHSPTVLQIPLTVFSEPPCIIGSRRHVPTCHAVPFVAHGR